MAKVPWWISLKHVSLCTSPALDLLTLNYAHIKQAETALAGREYFQEYI